MVPKPAGLRTSVMVVIGRILLFSSCLNRGSGSPRRSDAITTSIASSWGTGSPSRPPARMSSSCSNSSFSAMDHLSPQRLQASPLKLFDRPFTPSDLLRDLADALFLAEAHDDDAALIGR